MAQRFPEDYNGVLTGAPAIHFEKLGLGQTCTILFFFLKKPEKNKKDFD